MRSAQKKGSTRGAPLRDGASEGVRLDLREDTFHPHEHDGNDSNSKPTASRSLPLATLDTVALVVDACACDRLPRRLEVGHHPTCTHQP